MIKLYLILLALISAPLMSMKSDQKTLDQKLYDAVLQKETDLPHIQALIDAGADVNQKWENTTRSLLMTAIASKLSEASFMMIEKGADTNIADANGQTALHLACAQNLTDVCLLLIKKGVDLNKCPFTGSGQPERWIFVAEGFSRSLGAFQRLKHAPIAIAARNNNYQVCRALLAKGALLNPALDGCSMFLMSTLNESKASDACRAILAHTLFSSKEQVRTALMCLSKMRTSQFDCPTFLYKHFKTLLAPYLLYDIATQNKIEFLELLKEGNHFKIDLLDPSKADQTIQLLIREEIQGINQRKP